MSTGHQIQRSTHWPKSRAIRICAAGLFAVAAICMAGAAAAQQAPTPVYVPGNAALTGFSGAQPPAQIAPGIDPDQETFIDLNGPALRVVDLHHMGGPAQAQLIAVAKPFTVSAAQTGQLFGVAIDDSEPPNIYAAATSIYGLPIVAPGPDGRPQHIKVGAPNASFMPGLWGPQGGPGSIWKIDGATGAVTLFATVTTNGRANSGAALGGLAYDPETKSLYVADRESGLIHRLGPNGDDLGVYDHGVTGRSAQGLPPAPWTSQQPINIASPQFDSTQPATWNYAAPERRVFGLAVHDRRLYYAVADSLQIWSVGLNADGSFGNDAVIELAAPPSSGPTEISKITFDEQGRMFLADRPAPTGAFDFEALAVPAIGRVLRYAVVEIMPNGRRVWQHEPDEYAIGFPPDFRNANGGVAIGYNYNQSGEMLPGSCGGFMWTTGEDLRQPSDAKLAAQLGQSGPLDVNGLQGNGTWRIRHHDEPPLESYFIDYKDEYDDPAQRGHIGDVAIERLCPAVQRADLIPYGGAPPIGAPPAGPPRGGPPQGKNPPGPPNIPGPPPNTPPSGCAPGQLRDARTRACGSCSPPGIQINGTCCSVTQLAATAACSNSSCPSGQTPVGPSNFCCPSNQVYNGPGGAPACCSGPLVNGKCPPPPPPPKSICQKGYVPIGTSCCLASQVTSTGACCPAGQAPGGPNKSQCGQIVIIPIKIPPGPQCCASGIPTASGKCCPPANVTTGGECCPGPVDPKNRKACKTLIPLAACASGYTKMPDGSCCNNRYLGADGKSCNVSGRPCAPGEFRDERGLCVAIPSTSCPPGNFRSTSGACLPMPTAVCPPGEERDREGKCVPVPTPTCPSGEIRDREGHCVPERPAACPRGEIRNGEGRCIPEQPEPCPRGEIRNRDGACVPEGPAPCPPGEIRNRFGACVRVGPPPRIFIPGRPPGPMHPPPGMFVPRRPLP
jgi:hypothetical protein